MQIVPPKCANRQCLNVPIVPKYIDEDERTRRIYGILIIQDEDENPGESQNVDEVL